ncbi:hypothetical protein CRG98_013493, partial [Punica granatum]
MTILIDQPEMGSQLDVEKTASAIDDLVLDGGFVMPKSAADDGFMAPNINSFGNNF